LASDYHTLIDMNGDRKPDFIDTENQATENISEVFLNGGQKYWKVYFNNGSGFSATATQWNIPIVSDTQEYLLASDYHTVVDMNGDLKPDFLDTENEAIESSSQVFLNGSQKYWKVYLNNAPNLGNNVFGSKENRIVVYPNPVIDTFKVENAVAISTIMVFDFKGALLKYITTNCDGAVDISNLQAGIYLLKVTDIEGQIFTHRLVKE